jgi:putative membrane protein
MSSDRATPAANPERDPRIYFAAERTFLAWIRTGLAMMGFGFVVARFGLFLREVGLSQGIEATTPGWSRWFGVGLIALGMAVTAASAASHVATIDRFRRGDPFEGRPTWMGVAVAIMLALSGGLMIAYLWFYA